jgi:hypothetical protein
MMLSLASDGFFGGLRFAPSWLVWCVIVFFFSRVLCFFLPLFFESRKRGLNFVRTKSVGSMADDGFW